MSDQAKEDTAKLLNDWMDALSKAAAELEIIHDDVHCQKDFDFFCLESVRSRAIRALGDMPVGPGAALAAEVDRLMRQHFAEYRKIRREIEAAKERASHD